MAQDLSGTYIGESERGKITVILNQNQSQLSGSFTASDGSVYQLEGQVENEEIYGYLTGPKGRLFFEGFEEEGAFYFDVMPLGPDNEPDDEQLEEFILQPKRTESKSTAAKTVVRTKGSFTGEYSGSIQNTPTQLVLERNGNQLNGKIDANGYIYFLTGTVSSEKAEGTMRDVQQGGSLKFQATESNGQITLILLAQNPQTGQTQNVTFNFRRGNLPTSPSPQAAATKQNERDPSLIGAWYKQETMRSGDASMITRTYLTIHPDGTYAYGGSQGSFSSDSGSVNGGSGGNVIHGKWKTQGGVVFVISQDSPQWEPYARYYIEGNSMMFTFNNGSREIWERQ